MDIFKYTNGMPKRWFHLHSHIIAGVRTDILQMGDYALMNVYFYINNTSGGLWGKLFRKLNGG